MFLPWAPGRVLEHFGRSQWDARTMWLLGRRPALSRDMFISVLLNAVMIKDGWGQRTSELEMKQENVPTETRGKESREHQSRYCPRKSGTPRTSQLPAGKKGLVADVRIKGCCNWKGCYRSSGPTSESLLCD